MSAPAGAGRRQNRWKPFWDVGRALSSMAELALAAGNQGHRSAEDGGANASPKAASVVVLYAPR